MRARELPQFEREQRAEWHESRARGQRERIERVEACRTREIIPLCTRTGLALDPVKLGCGGWRYCMVCRAEHCREERTAINDGIGLQRDLWWKERHRQRGRWSERFLTLTVPHSGFAALDLAIIHDSWKRFFRMLRYWLFKHHSLTHEQRHHMPYVRVLEITGSDDGHVHLHVWILSPYVAHPILRMLWGRALRSHVVPAIPVVPFEHGASDRAAALGFSRVLDGDFSGLTAANLIASDIASGELENPAPTCAVDRLRHGAWTRLLESKGTLCRTSIELAEQALARSLAELDRYAARYRKRKLRYVPWPVLDVRSANTEVGNELVKYLTKDIGPTRELVDPFEYAQLIEATEGRRLLCTSRKFRAPSPGPRCPCCERPWARWSPDPDNASAPTVAASSPRGPPAYVHT